jgi:hypothetical protein
MKGKSAIGVLGAAAFAVGAYYVFKRVSAKLAWDEDRRAEESERLIDSYEAYSEGDLGPKPNGRKKRAREVSA